MVDDTNKIVLISIPKTGSISLYFSLGYANVPEPEIYHCSLDTLLLNHPHAIDYFKASFIRNPWDRMLSLYNDFRYKRIYQYSEKVTVDKPLFGEFKDFNDFCIRLKDSQWLTDVFFQSQYEMLSYKDSNPFKVMDFIGRFETYTEDYDNLCKALNITGRPLLNMNKSVKAVNNYRNHYNHEAKQAIELIYGNDIDTFKYSF